MKRKQISSRTRFEIFKRDSFTCQYCGRKPPVIVLWIDHILAVANGGTNDRENLITSCDTCNMGKSDVPLERIVTPNLPSVQIERERAKQLELYGRFLKERRQAQEQLFQICAEAWMDLKDVAPTSEGWKLPGNLAASIRYFLTRLPSDEILHSITVAGNKLQQNPWWRPNRVARYFCGVCWRKIKEAELRS